jgi:NAD dependent epimerase/dehydratase family enzyme
MMGVDKDSAFDIFSGLARLGLSGKIGSGRQYVSWVHEVDLARSVEFLIDSDLSGPVNISSPNPVTQAEFARDLRVAWGVRFGLPATPGMAAIGAWFLNGDTELVMKSRRVVPTRLTEAGFQFRYPIWPVAARDLVQRMQSSNH